MRDYRWEQSSAWWAKKFYKGILLSPPRVCVCLLFSPVDIAVQCVWSHVRDGNVSSPLSSSFMRLQRSLKAVCCGVHGCVKMPGGKYSPCDVSTHCYMSWLALYSSVLSVREGWLTFLCCLLFCAPARLFSRGAHRDVEWDGEGRGDCLWWRRVCSPR